MRNLSPKGTEKFNDYTGDRYSIEGKLLFSSRQIEDLVSRIRSLEPYLKYISIYNPVRIEVVRVNMSGSEFIDWIVGNENSDSM